MTVFYTGRGDKGKSKIGSKNLPKDDVIFQFLGELDELNCLLGLCKADALGNRELKDLVPIFGDIQEALFVIQAEVAAIGGGYEPRFKIGADKIKTMEEVINSVDLELPSVKKFVIPGGSKLSAQVDLARAVARRVERTALIFSRKKKLRPELKQFLNRVSSLLFALARLVNYKLKIKEENPSYK